VFRHVLCHVIFLNFSTRGFFLSGRHLPEKKKGEKKRKKKPSLFFLSLVLSLNSSEHHRIEHSVFPAFHHPGLELPFVSLIIGMHSGQAILWTGTRLQKRRQSKGLPPLKPTPDNLKRRKAVAWIAGILWLGILLPGNIIMAAFEFGDTGRHIQSIAACVAPLGVWLRWYLSRFNGSVLKGSPWEWVPWGTLAANLLASVLVTVDKVADVQVRVWLGLV
jgi:hypothetical protein